MIISCSPDVFRSLLAHPHPYYPVPDTFPVRFVPGDRIEFSCDGDMMQRLVAEVIDVRLNAKAHQWTLALHPIADIPAYIDTPGGLLTVRGDNQSRYPGYSIWIDNTEAAGVEWHPEHHSLVLRTFNGHDKNPQHYHKWDGAPLPSNFWGSSEGGRCHDDE